MVYELQKQIIFVRFRYWMDGQILQFLIKAGAYAITFLRGKGKLPEGVTRIDVPESVVAY